MTSVNQKILDEEQLSFDEEFLSERDPSILHFLLASGDEVYALEFVSAHTRLWLLQPARNSHVSCQQVNSKQLRDDLMTMLIAGHETSAAVLTWTFYLLAKVLSHQYLHKIRCISFQPVKTNLAFFYTNDASYVRQSAFPL